MKITFTHFQWSLKKVNEKSVLVAVVRKCLSNVYEKFALFKIVTSVLNSWESR